MELSKFQGYQIERIARSAILDAPYNPRKIADGNRERLAKGLTRHKLVMPPVWNKRTGNLVSGHQRLSILDEKHKGGDYLLDVAAIDVPEKQEVEINILLNNESAMGEFDLGALKGLSQEFEIDLSNVGFSREDLYINFDMEKALPEPSSPEQKAAIKEKRNLEKREYADQKIQGQTHDSEAKQDYIISIVFPTNREAVEFLQRHKLDATKRMFPADRFLEGVGLA